MTWEQGETGPQRLRAGFATLLIGTSVLFMAWGLAIWRGQDGQREVISREHKLEPPSPGRIMPVVSAGMMMYGMVLIVVLFASVIALMRISRNYRNAFLTTRPKPTPVSDVWQMHKTPDIPLEDEPPPEAGPPPADRTPTADGPPPEAGLTPADGSTTDYDPDPSEGKTDSNGPKSGDSDGKRPPAGD